MPMSSDWPTSTVDSAGRRNETGAPPSDVLSIAADFLALPQRPTAVFCASDDIAIGFLKVVRRAGVQVPRDVSLLGFDGNDLADYTDPVLSTVRQPRHELGRSGAEALLQMLDGAFDLTRRVIHLPVELAARETTAPPAGAAPQRE
jgi:LacI family repressor for deo operon, udp, cdd, tsx, nupC, and nupG